MDQGDFGAAPGRPELIRFDDARRASPIFPLLPRCPNPWIWIAKPNESSVNKFIRGGGAPTATLPVERPAKNELSSAIMFSSHPSKPMVDESRLSDTGPGNDRNDIYIRVCPHIVQKSDIFLSTKKIASCNRQSGY